MDIQLKRGLLDILILASLYKVDSYGYKIVKDVSLHISITESTLYPILKRLELNGCVEVYTKEYNGRLRKYYKITHLGIKKINDFKEEWKEVIKVYKYIEGETHE
ncbi:MAG: PadR family transcriptional regulator [Erysipelotrichaceae bacterium]|nr:PadR family transcriptional regulator [Erysipelotrichaceae bacterium]